jgi:hypothetical protein
MQLAAGDRAILRNLQACGGQKPNSQNSTDDQQNLAQKHHGLQGEISQGGRLVARKKSRSGAKETPHKPEDFW